MNNQRVAIIGRPNVGKSTLFNRLIGKRVAIVDDRPGVTRDWKEYPAQLFGLHFTLIDTAGLEGFENTEIFNQIRIQTDRIIEQADVILFMVDGLDGILPSDHQLASRLRRRHKPTILLVNKVENIKKAIGYAESHRLGLGDPIALSAVHGEGLDTLYEALQPLLSSNQLTQDSGQNTQITEEITDQTNQIASLKSAASEFAYASYGPLSVAIVGRPNAGKSTLVNKLIGAERLITSDQPGVTRDAITIDWQWKNIPIQLVDTAGIRRRARVTDSLERTAVSDAMQAIKYAHVVILLVDARYSLDKQDLLIASRVLDEGRCLVIGLNKWDLADAKIAKQVQSTLESSLGQVKSLPCIPLSAKLGRNLDKLMQAVIDVYHQWNQRLSTGKLNQWLGAAIERHPPPISGLGRIRLKYMTQIKTRPPTFVIFVSKPTELPESYSRYLSTSLAKQFNLASVPIRLQLRKGKNPFMDKA